MDESISDTDRSKAIAMTKHDVIVGKMTIAAAMKKNRLSDGSEPCSRQNVYRYAKAVKVEEVRSDVTPDNSTEVGRRKIAHMAALTRYKKCSTEGIVGKGKYYGMAQIKAEMEEKYLQPDDTRLVLRTLNRHAKKGITRYPRRGKPRRDVILLLPKDGDDGTEEGKGRKEEDDAAPKKKAEEEEDDDDGKDDGGNDDVDGKDGNTDEVGAAAKTEQSTPFRRGTKVYIVSPGSRHSLADQSSISWVLGTVWNSNVDGEKIMYEVIYHNRQENEGDVVLLHDGEAEENVPHSLIKIWDGKSDA